MRLDGIYARRASRSTRERALTVRARHVREFTSPLYASLLRYSRTRFSSYWLHREATTLRPHDPSDQRSALSPGRNPTRTLRVATIIRL